MRPRLALLALVAMTTGSCGGPSEPELASVRVTPSSASVFALGDTVRLSATAMGAGGDALSGYAFSWSSSDEGVARVSSAGVVTAIGDGVATISATTSGVEGSARITVTQRASQVVITPDGATLTALGDGVALLATLADAQGNAMGGGTVSWTSSDRSVVAVDTTGYAVAVGEGSATVGATIGTLVGDAPISVSQVVTSVLVTSDSSMIAPGGETALTPRPLDSRGNEVVGRAARWATLDSTVITVDADGVARGVGTRLGPGTLVATVDGVEGQIDVEVVAQFVSIGAGGLHSCAVSTLGDAYCWGSNDRNQLGNGTISESAVPVLVPGGIVFASISTGRWHTCGLTAAGEAYCWGDNWEGAVGNGSTAPVPTPEAVAGGFTFETLSAGYRYTCGVVTGGAAYCWGANVAGQLGTGDLVGSSVPLAVAGGISFRFINAGGGDHTCGVADDGAAWCWGANTYGQLGTGGFGSREPAAVSSGEAFASVSARGVGHSCGTTTGNVAYCWGMNRVSQLGNGETTDRDLPVLVSGGLSFKSVTAGWYHTCGIALDDLGYCWGSNQSGRVGHGEQTVADTPTLVAGPLYVKEFGLGDSHTCAVTTEGGAYCWGSGLYGALGEGTGSSSPVPVRVAGSRY